MTPPDPTGEHGGAWSRDAIRDLLVSTLADRGAALGLTPVDIDGRLDVLGSGLVDSLGFVELVIGVEQALGQPLDLEHLDFDRLDSLDAIADQLHRLQQPRGGG